MMSSSRQKRGTWGHVMAMFDGHFKCAPCREKGVGDDPCVKKQDCPIRRAFTAEEIHQSATPTYRTRKERDQKETIPASPASTTLALMDPLEVTLLGQVEGERYFC